MHGPGNVRELQHVLERACIVSTDGKLRFDLPKEAQKQREQQIAATRRIKILTNAELRELETNNIRLHSLQQKERFMGRVGQQHYLP